MTESKSKRNENKRANTLLDYKIIRSGSKGNAVRVDDVMFDCGVPFKEMEAELYKCKFLIITHTHSDHLNMRTFKAIKRKFPRLTIVGNWHVAGKVNGVEKITGDESILVYKDRKITSFKCVHDVPCHGYVIEKDGMNIIYATDTSTLEFAPQLKYDYFFIESNHDSNKINAIQGNSYQKYGYDAYAGAMRHLSTQSSKAFYYMNRRSKESEWIELHKSERFY